MIRNMEEPLNQQDTINKFKVCSFIFDFNCLLAFIEFQEICAVNDEIAQAALERKNFDLEAALRAFLDVSIGTVANQFSYQFRAKIISQRLLHARKTIESNVNTGK